MEAGAKGPVTVHCIRKYLKSIGMQPIPPVLDTIRQLIDEGLLVNEARPPRHRLLVRTSIKGHGVMVQAVKTERMKPWTEMDFGQIEKHAALALAYGLDSSKAVNKIRGQVHDSIIVDEAHLFSGPTRYFTKLSNPQNFPRHAICPTYLKGTNMTIRKGSIFAVTERRKENDQLEVFFKADVVTSTGVWAHQLDDKGAKVFFDRDNKTVFHVLTEADYRELTGQPSKFIVDDFELEVMALTQDEANEAVKKALEAAGIKIVKDNN